MKTKLLIVLASVLIPISAVVLQANWNTAETPPEDNMITACGIVFHDANGNRKYDDGEKPLPKIKVSNGKDIVLTDAQGKYQLSINNEDAIIFVIQPSGYQVPMSKDMLPQFYYVHRPKGAPKAKYKGVEPTGPLPDSVDFPLYPQKQPETFKALLFGDPQPRDQKEIDYISHDVLEELRNTDASMGITLGDIMFDNLSLFESQCKAVALLGIPWYNVLGNHDINYDARNRADANNTYERVFGPSYYSFDYGKVHFLVLDDIDWYEAKTKGKKSSWRYRGGFGKEQMQFIRNDLAMVPENQLIVLLMHIPLYGVQDRQELYRLIEKRKFCISISGHTHWQEHRFITKKDGWKGPEPHHHIVNVTVSGSWWSGAPDERGIPHTMMRDGAPNGYSIITFDGTDYTLDFKAAGRPANYQMNIQTPEEIPLDKLGETDVYVNVFNGSEKSKVEMRLGNKGSWTTMTRKVAYDPHYVKLYKTEKAILDKYRSPKKKDVKLPWRQLPGPTKSSHLWHAKLPVDAGEGVHVLQVRTTDMFGRTSEDSRVVRIVIKKEEK